MCSLIRDILIEIFGVLFPQDLLQCELVCRRWVVTIRSANIWRTAHINHTENICGLYWHPTNLIKDYKTYHGLFWKEVQFHQSIDYTHGSQYFWRANHLKRLMPETHRTMESPRFTVDGNVYTLVLQRLTVGDAHQLGIFVRSYQAAHCVYMLSPQTNSYESILSNITEKRFRQRGETSGWFFTMAQLHLNEFPNELLVKIEMFTAPTDHRLVPASYQHLKNPLIPLDCKRYLMGVLSDAAMHSNRIKVALQSSPEGYETLIQMLESVQDNLSGQTIMAVSGLIWNMLDQHTLLVDAGSISRIVRIVCKHLDMEYRPHERESVSTSLMGMLWNLPVSNAHFKPLLDPVLVEHIIRVGQDDNIQRVHFTCCHLLCSMICKKGLDPDTHKRAQKYVEGYIQHASHWGGENGLTLADLGVSISLRDLVDYFIPYLRSDDLSVVAFGQWSFAGYYDLPSMQPIELVL
eukprot:PhF_6_TR38986/c0_g1_i1/m.58339